MDNIQIEGGNGCPLQNCAHSAHHDEIDVVTGEVAEDGQEIKFGFFPGLSL
ncbi:MAG TPA: hypothetical protein VG028_19860 [Terriglobia bacterium]|nr:hypothetical protein [Terriglobia bacterium]